MQETVLGTVQEMELVTVKGIYLKTQWIDSEILRETAQGAEQGLE